MKMLMLRGNQKGYNVLNKSQRFLLGLMLLCLGYLSFEIFFNRYASLLIDEFWFAHVIYQYKDALPYRDFSPYKAVLGYYLLLKPLLLKQAIFPALISVKDWIAILNTSVFIIAGLTLKHIFSPKAVLISLILVLISNTNLFYSTNIRVDLLAYWFSLFSCLALLKNRYALAGLLLGLGFVTSQKAIWFLVASNGALSLYWLFFERRFTALFKIIRLNLTALLVIACYIIFWGYFAGIGRVIQNVWFDASAMYHLDWYNSARLYFWHTIVLHNPALFLLAPLSFISLFIRYEHDSEYKPRFLITIYSLIILTCLAFYKQVFPYYMQITIPVFLLLYAAFISWLFKLFKNEQTKLGVSASWLWLFAGCYIIGIILLLVLLNLPLAYGTLAIIVLLLTFYVTQLNSTRIHIATFIPSVISIVGLIAGIIYPSILNITHLAQMNGNYQKANINVVNQLLADGSDYLAGIELVYNKKQPIAGLRHLMGPAIAYLQQPTAQLQAVMLPSLYEDPHATLNSALEALQKSRVKFYVNNYRIQALPPVLKAFLSSQYDHLWGSIYLYAPEINADQKDFLIKFKGSYILDMDSQQTAVIDGKKYRPQQVIELDNKIHTSHTKEKYRLKLIPDKTALFLDPRFSQDQWERFLFI
jgi:hypothetical protein